MRNALLLVVMVLFGCSGASSAPAVKPTATYSYEIRGPGQVTAGSGPSFDVAGGGHTVKVADGKLTVDGKSYGTLVDFDKVKVDESGKVTVNGVERKAD